MKDKRQIYWGRQMCGSWYKPLRIKWKCSEIGNINEVLIYYPRKTAKLTVNGSIPKKKNKSWNILVSCQRIQMKRSGGSGELLVDSCSFLLHLLICDGLQSWQTLKTEKWSQMKGEWFNHPEGGCIGGWICSTKEVKWNDVRSTKKAWPYTETFIPYTKQWNMRVERRLLVSIRKIGNDPDFSED